MSAFKRTLASAFLTAALILTGSPLVPTARAYSDADASWAAEVIERAIRTDASEWGKI